MDLRTVQAPIKRHYREDAGAALLRLKASATSDDPISCNVDIGRAVYEAQAHAGVGGSGTSLCSGDLLLGALAACAQITCSMVAASTGIPVRGIAVTVEGDLDLRGTLGISREARVGFEAIRLDFVIEAPEATPEQVNRLKRATEQYCVVMQTLRTAPDIEVAWHGTAPDS